MRRLIASTVGHFPVRVKSGVAMGARWTLFPWSSYWRGTHEPDVQRALMVLGGGTITGWNCWDLGAHYGIYSVALARRVGPTGQVAAFEPNPASFARLERHRRMNRLSWLKTYQAAVSDQSGSSELLNDGVPDSTTTHLRHDDEGHNAGTASVSIRTLRLDGLVESGELRPPQFVKVDVEGHGHRAIEGMRLALAASRPTLLIAFHSDREVRGVLSVLDPLGYTRSEVTRGTDGSMIGGDYLFSG